MSKQIYRCGEKRILVEDDVHYGSPHSDEDSRVKFAFAHKRYSLPNDSGMDLRSMDGWKEVEESLREACEAKTILPVYMLDHSGVTIGTAPFGDRWDSGQIGFVYSDQPNDEDALLHEVSLYDAYLRGDVYEYRECDACGNVIDDGDGCYEFFGSDFSKNGLFDAAFGTTQGIEKQEQ